MPWENSDMKILLTGFEKFRDNEVNPSKELVVSSSLVSCCPLILPVSYSSARQKLLAAIEVINPDIVISFGLAASRKEITVEKTAFNSLKAAYPDEDGILKSGETIDESLPKTLSTSFPVMDLVNQLKDEGFVISLSEDPGRFICNEVYFTSLMKKPQSLFIHLPTFSRSSFEEDKKLLKAVLSFVDVISNSKQH